MTNLTRDTDDFVLGTKVKTTLIENSDRPEYLRMLLDVPDLTPFAVNGHADSGCVYFTPDSGYERAVTAPLRRSGTSAALSAPRASVAAARANCLTHIKRTQHVKVLCGGDKHIDGKRLPCINPAHYAFA